MIRIPLFILFGSGAGFKQVWTANVGLKKRSYVIFFFIVFPKLFEDFFTCLCVQKATIGPIIFLFLRKKPRKVCVRIREEKKTLIRIFYPGSATLDKSFVLLDINVET